MSKRTRYTVKRGAVLEPFDVDRSNWFYAARGRFEFIHEVWMNGKLLRTDTIPVSTSKIRKALALLDAKKAAK